MENRRYEIRTKDAVEVTVTQERFDADCEYCSNRVETAVLQTNGKVRLTVQHHSDCIRCINDE